MLQRDQNNNQLDLTNGKFIISVPDLIKLISVVAAIGMSYAIASSRLTQLEKSIVDAKEARTVIAQRIETLEQSIALHTDDANDINHDFDLRLQSIEEAVFGASKPSSTARRVRQSSTPSYTPYRPSRNATKGVTTSTHTNAQPEPSEQSPDRTRQYHSLKL